MMRRRQGLAVSLAVAVWTLGNLAAGLTAEQGNAKNGQASFEQYCAVCHGKRGLGNGPMAKATTPPAPKLTSREVRERSDAEMLNAVANGVGSAMPAWRGVLSDQQLLDVIAYVRSLAG